MFGIPEEWELPFNIFFLIVMVIIAWTGIRYRDAEGNHDFVRVLFGSIAATYFFLVLMTDVLGIQLF